MSVRIDVIGLDADDTLWHTEVLYSQAEKRLSALLAPFLDGDRVAEELFETEMGNLAYFGYGIKSFALSMIETAIRVSGGQIGAQDIQQIVEVAKEMQQAPVRLLDHVGDVIPRLAAAHSLMLITKGDLFDQEAKLARSGLASYFAEVKVVTDKTPETYRALLSGHRIEPQRFLMVGNSLRSDILPVVSLGAHAIHIPYPITWAHEMVSVEEWDEDGYVELEHIGLLPEFVRRLHQAD
jgi:putative hydrolase of the HAD superfamily